MLVDTHCHLDQFDDPGQILSSAAAVGVDRVVAVGQDETSMRRVLQLGRDYPGAVLTGLGIHPVNVIQQDRETTEQGLQLLADELAGADELGEVGLVYKWAESAEDRALQDDILTGQFELAAGFRKPVNLHSRRCLRQVMERAIAFHRDTGLNAQLHWFTQSEKLVRICNDEGLFVSAGPSILHGEDALSVAGAIADDLLLLETDAPVPIGGRPGHPQRTREVAEKLAAIKGVSLDELAALTSANFARYLVPSPEPADGVKAAPRR